MERILLFWDGRLSSAGETSTKQRRGDRKPQGLSKQIDCLQTKGCVWEARNTGIGNINQSLGCQAEVHVSNSESFPVRICGGCLEDTKAGVIRQEGCSQTEASEKVRVGRESWWQNATKRVHIPEDWAWAGKRADTQQKAGQEKRPPGIPDITKNCFDFPTPFSFLTLLTLQTYLSQDE